MMTIITQVVIAVIRIILPALIGSLKNEGEAIEIICDDDTADNFFSGERL